MKLFLTLKKIKGYSLVEILVVLGLFSGISTLSLGALFNAQSVNARLQETQAILDNMNLSTQTITREIRFGSDFYGTTTFAITSTNGNSGGAWVTRASAADNQWGSVVYRNGLFVAVGVTDSGLGRIMTSPDGVTWTSRTSPSTNSWQSVTFGNGLFVAVSSTGNDNRVMTSPDGITWTSRTSASDNEWISVTFGNGLFVAVALSGSNRVMTSPDGINWTSRSTSLGEVSMWKSVTYGNGLYVAVAFLGSNNVMTSPDGINWTIRAGAQTAYWNSITYGRSLFVAVGKYCTVTCVMTSPDGVTWTSRAGAANNEWSSVAYGNGFFAAVSTTGTGNRVMISVDGITWTIGISGANNSWGSVAYGDNVFVAVSQDGTGNRVMTYRADQTNVVTTRRNCVSCTALIFKPSGTEDDLDRVAYYVSNGVLYKNVYNHNGATQVFQMTSNDVNITSFFINIDGANTSGGGTDDEARAVDYRQPMVTLYLSGVTRPAKQSTPPATFNIETVVSAREIDNK